MTDDLDWINSGERLVPAASGGGVIDAEHLARYRMALSGVAGKVVLDAGCGVGWGSQLLLTVGPAAQVIAIDNFPPAIDYACANYPGPNYQVGDLTKLDLADESVDVVVCFEALEHVSDHAAAIAEFARVLRPGGVLFVSSPNPSVYPHGNPYHVHEVEPGQLRASVAAAFSNTVLLRQELLIGSMVIEARTGLEAVDVVRIGAADGPTDQYGIVVASSGELPPIDGTLVLAPSQQLTGLDELGRALAADRAAFDASAAEIAIEHERLNSTVETAAAYAASLVERISELDRQLVEAGAALRSVMDERDGLVQRVLAAEMRAELAEHELTTERAVGRETDQRQHHELDELRHDRDELLTQRLHDEQLLARGELAPGLEFAQLAHTAQALAEQLNAIQRSHSWRITAPLRRLRSAQLRADLYPRRVRGQHG